MRIRESLHEDKEGEIVYILWKSDKSGANNSISRSKDERSEERSIRQRLITSVITTNSHPLSSESKRR